MYTIWKGEPITFCSGFGPFLQTPAGLHAYEHASHLQARDILPSSAFGSSPSQQPVRQDMPENCRATARSLTACTGTSS